VSYDRVYREHSDYFGAEPQQILLDYYHLLDKSKPVLDIGAGQGRHALFLARQGFSVDAIEPSKMAVESLQSAAAKEKLPIRAYHSRFQDFVAEPGSYSGILLFGVIQELGWESIHLLLDKVRLWCSKGGLIFVTGFTIEDPSFAEMSQEEQIGKNSFRDEDGNIHTYLEPNEILELFDRCRLVHHWEGLGPLHKHGDGPEHRHGSVRAVFWKR